MEMEICHCKPSLNIYLQMTEKGYVHSTAFNEIHQKQHKDQKKESFFLSPKNTYSPGL